MLDVTEVYSGYLESTSVNTLESGVTSAELVHLRKHQLPVFAGVPAASAVVRVVSAELLNLHKHQLSVSAQVLDFRKILYVQANYSLTPAMECFGKVILN